LFLGVSSGVAIGGLSMQIVSGTISPIPGWNKKSASSIKFLCNSCGDFISDEYDE
jgi:hypothetical protein